MMLGWRLAIPGEVSVRLTNALPTIQTILRSWVPECSDGTIVEFEAFQGAPSTRRADWPAAASGN